MFPLTPTLSLRERENSGTVAADSPIEEFIQREE
jgi:hypothetical protein